MLTSLLKESSKDIEILDKNSDKFYISRILKDLNISSESLLWEIITNTWGILVDCGWLRIIGSWNIISRNILDWNNDKTKGMLLVADDIIWGFFALNLWYFDGEIWNIFYFAPELLEWEDLEMKYANFINWAIMWDTNKFYESFRWDWWESETKEININMGLSIYPFLWTENIDINNRSKKTISIEEIWCLSMDFYRKMRD